MIGGLVQAAGQVLHHDRKNRSVIEVTVAGATAIAQAAVRPARRNGR